MSYKLYCYLKKEQNLLDRKGYIEEDIALDTCTEERFSELKDIKNELKSLNSKIVKEMNKELNRRKS